MRAKYTLRTKLRFVLRGFRDCIEPENKYYYLGVDEPYYRDVIVPKLKDVHWDVYWHKFDDASIFIEKYKLPEAKSKEW